MDRTAGGGRSSLRRSPLVWAFGLLFIGVFSTNEFALVDLMHRANLGELSEVAAGVLAGRPNWAAYQARLLGPLGFSAAGWFAGRALPDEADPQLAMRLFFLAAIGAKNAVLFGLAAVHARDVAAGAALAVLGSVLFLLFSDSWLYTWDLVELMVFSGLAFLIARWSGAGPAFLLLFAVALLNRESAAFFGLWLICLDAARSWLGRRPQWRDAALGVLLIAATAVYVMAVRQWLLIEEVGAATYTGLGGNHIQLLRNLATVVDNLASPRIYIDAWIIAILAYGGALAASGLKRADPRRLALGLFSWALLAAIFTFGLVNEARVFLIYVPLFVFSAAELWIRRSRDPNLGDRAPARANMAPAMPAMRAE